MTSYTANTTGNTPRHDTRAYILRIAARGLPVSVQPHLSHLAPSTISCVDTEVTCVCTGICMMPAESHVESAIRCPAFTHLKRCSTYELEPFSFPQRLRRKGRPTTLRRKERKNSRLEIFNSSGVSAYAAAAAAATATCTLAGF